MTIDKEALFNYGLDVDGYLNHDSNNQGKLIKNINPKNNYTFYVLTLFNKGVEGTLRTELKIDKQKLTYRINDKEIDCGDINGKQL